MRAIGSSVPRGDAPGKTTGQTRYGGDFPASDAQWMKVVFAGVPHARIRRLDVTEAAAMPGVTAVLTDADVPRNQYGIVWPDQPVLCGLNSTPAARTVRWVGDKLCLVVADSPAHADAAAQKVQVDLEALPAVFDPEAALRPDAPLVHDYAGYPLATRPRNSNLLACTRIRLGDAERGLAAADAVVSDVYATHYQEHAYLETEAGRAWPTADGRIAVRSGGQWMHDDREQVAAALRLPVAQVQIAYAAVGGAFGGKEDLHLQLLLALAAYRTGRPVQCAWSREESIRYHHKRHPFRFDCQLGATRDGRLTVLTVDAVCDAGAYASTSAKVLGNAVVGCAGCYEIPHVRIEGRAVFTNNCVTGAFRGFGSPQAAFMLETQMNRLARALDIPPDELRRINAWREGSTMATRGPVPPGCMAREVLQAATQAAAAQETPRGPADRLFQTSLRSTARRVARGRGLALICKNVGFGQGIVDSCHAWIELRGGAEVEEVWLGTVGADTGQGAHTAFRQMAADAVGAPVDKVRLQAASTDDAESSGSASASRLTFFAGAAIHEAARRALAAWAEEERPARGEYVFSTRMTTPFDPETGAGIPAVAFGYCAQVADVAVDLDTGHVSVLRLVSAHDVGRAVNPQAIEGQIEGAVAQGVGWTLYENMAQRDGRILNPSLSAYLIPGVRDVPAEVVPVIVEGGAPDHPLGVKGMAEMGLIPVAPALAAALFDAAGVWITELPLTPERVWQALQKRSLPA